MRLPIHYAFSALLVISAAACGDDGGDDDDDDDVIADAAGDDDDDVVADAALDAPVEADAAIDGPVTLFDASLDAPPSELTQICTDLCSAILSCFFGPDAGPPPEEQLLECVGACSEDLSNCSAEQLEATHACSDSECGPEGETLLACISAPGCAMKGGGGGGGQ